LKVRVCGPALWPRQDILYFGRLHLFRRLIRLTSLRLWWIDHHRTRRKLDIFKFRKLHCVIFCSNTFEDWDREGSGKWLICLACNSQFNII
jgi:hypothetical protein